jgi:crossover junction endodeoxyribonuclease RuvC
MRPTSATPEASGIRVLGIDPGSHRTGYGLVEEHRGRLHLVAAGAIAANPGLALGPRLLSIYEGLERVLEDGHPQEVAVEGLFHAKNARSALLLGHARGTALVAVARRQLPVFEYAPREVKKALVGTGTAEKHQVEAMVRVLLGLTSPVRPHDAADGVAIAICHLHSRRLRRLGGDDRPKSPSRRS